MTKFIITIYLNNVLKISYNYSVNIQDSFVIVVIQKKQADVKGYTYTISYLYIYDYQIQKQVSSSCIPEVDYA